MKSCLSLDSYIKPQLEEVATYGADRCLSLDSYIKPQPVNMRYGKHFVVYLLIPTSNHNYDNTLS